MSLIMIVIVCDAWTVAKLIVLFGLYWIFWNKFDKFLVEFIRIELVEPELGRVK